MGTKLIKPGQVIWAQVPDRNGHTKPDPRPLLVIHPGPLHKQAPLCCLGVSTREDIDPKDPSIVMPWNASTGDTTGLYKWCAVVLLWRVLVEPWDVEDVSGVVTPAFLAEVIATRQRTLDFPPAR